MNIRTLDLSDFVHGSPEQRQAFVDGLLQSFDDSGFVKLVNHGFSQEQLTTLFGWVSTVYASG